MDTEGVRLFVLAAEKLNINAAGRAPGMAPAVASARLAKLEKLLEADVLRRSTRKVALSLEGGGYSPTAAWKGANWPTARVLPHGRHWFAVQRKDLLHSGGGS